MRDFGGDLAGKFGVGVAAENQPATVRAFLKFNRRGDEAFARPAFGRAVFRAGVQAERRLCNFRQSKFFPRCFDFFRRDEQLRRERLRIRAERGGEVEILVDVMSGTVMRDA